MSGTGNPANPPATSGYMGSQWQFDGNGSFNALAFVIDQICAGKAHAAYVRVMSVTNSGGLSPAGMVSVQPLVDQIDGQGNRTPHGQIFNLPYFRIQGGTNAIICDPGVGDDGIAIFTDRDSSVAVATQNFSPPGSKRQFSHSDGFYFGAFQGVTPTQYIQFTTTGINIVTPGTLTLNGMAIVTTGTLTNNAKNVGSGHEHSGVQTGGGNTGPPL